MTSREEVHAKIVSYVQRHPELNYDTISKRMGISQAMLKIILRKAGYRRCASTLAINFDALENN